LFFCEKFSAGSLFVEHSFVPAAAMWCNVRAYEPSKNRSGPCIDGDGRRDTANESKELSHHGK
jgi:hypothetical protein